MALRKVRRWRRKELRIELHYTHIPHIYRIAKKVSRLITRDVAVVIISPQVGLETRCGHFNTIFGSTFILSHACAMFSCIVHVIPSSHQYLLSANFFWLYPKRIGGHVLSIEDAFKRYCSNTLVCPVYGIFERGSLRSNTPNTTARRLEGSIRYFRASMKDGHLLLCTFFFVCMMTLHWLIHILLVVVILGAAIGHLPIITASPSRGVFG